MTDRPVRTLPPLAELAREIAATLGGTARVLPATSPTAAVAFAGFHRLLVRDHTWIVTLSLPTSSSWQIRTADDWRAIEPAVRDRLAAPARLAMADAIVALVPVLEAQTGTAWVANIPGTPVPSEAWLAGGDGSIGLFQDATAVRIVIWVGSEGRWQTVATHEAFAGLGPWLAQALADQAVARTAAAAEAAREAARPVPALDDVLAALRGGARIRTGGGRCSDTYYWRGGRLRVDVFDEGYEETRDATVEQLQHAIAADPAPFRAALGAT